MRQHYFFAYSSRIIFVRLSHEFNIAGLVLVMYATVTDFILGSVMFFVVLNVPSIKTEVEGASYRYRRQAIWFFIAWFTILVTVIILQFSAYTIPAVVGTLQISNILNVVIELLNTIEFVVAYEFMRIIEFLIAVGVGLFLNDNRPR